MWRAPPPLDFPVASRQRDQAYRSSQSRLRMSLRVLQCEVVEWLRPCNGKVGSRARIFLLGSLATSVHMCHPGWSAAHSELSEYLMACIGVVCPTGKTPTETCPTQSAMAMRCMRYSEQGISHAICPFWEHIDNKFFVFLSPSPHCGIGLNEKADKIIDVLPLTTFFMERHAIRW